MSPSLMNGLLGFRKRTAIMKSEDVLKIRDGLRIYKGRRINPFLSEG